MLDRLSTERGFAIVLTINDLNHTMAIADRVMLCQAESARLKAQVPTWPQADTFNLSSRSMGCLR
ncbi:ABC-type cobalamin/Fe3+-siderophores transport system ATPase subunit [Pararhizobium capsulatum DSM 1112]|uniref:ABC-type cobalamin/Fe3+-siderophores transport system ATPase subunit n=1 Tax=Pararhizobium capsulatum DSM 1112 TaxID=1121113 RepID=A0ABU0BJN3_9HYPH|nr:ABC-type cobalamin/Fe3+-siderophores transport system ATPase subunit [Pararhizobium capsulatum DSM 1112]